MPESKAGRNADPEAEMEMELKDSVETGAAPDTIAAISTPMGEGGIGIVRISGPAARAVAARLFRPTLGADRHMTHGWVADAGGTVIDEVMAVYMQGPHSYTAEDVVELQCHGGQMSLRLILQAVLQSGARLAEPGEFTRRAFLNGRLDLSQAEAVIDLIQAKSPAGAAAAAVQLTGRYAERIRAIRNRLIDVLVDLTVDIDYPDEDVEALTYEKLDAALTDTASDIRTLLATADTGRIVRDGLRVAILGRPNVGKSSLLNALLREERAIVTTVPGTTRDTIEVAMSLDGVPILLTDTAGIREATDEVERLGIEKSLSAGRTADLSLLVLDGSQPLCAEDEQALAACGDGRILLILNKADLPAVVTPAQAQAWFAAHRQQATAPGAEGGQPVAETEVIAPFAASDAPAIPAREAVEPSPAEDAAASGVIPPVVASSVAAPKPTTSSVTAPEPAAPTVISTSVVTGQGLADIEDVIRRLVGEGSLVPGSDILVTSLRHKELLQEALAAVESALQLVAERQPPELIQIDVNACFEALGQITGDHVDGEVLDAVFSRFCLGK